MMSCSHFEHYHIRQNSRDWTETGHCNLLLELSTGNSSFPMLRCHVDILNINILVNFIQKWVETGHYNLLIAVSKAMSWFPMLFRIDINLIQYNCNGFKIVFTIICSRCYYVINMIRFFLNCHQLVYWCKQWLYGCIG